MKRYVAMGAVMMGVWLGTGAAAQAHGLWGHVHVTGWAAENLPQGELKAFLSEPEVFNALLFGAAFTDSGYFPQGGELARKSRAYSEHSHWEPFIADFIAWIKSNDPPPWQTLESRKRVAFLMGCASHGLQDEVFDSLFLPQVGFHDDGGQDEADPASDGFMALDMLIRFEPEQDLPMETLLELYQPLGEEITEDVILRSVRPMMSFYVNHRVGIDVARGQGMIGQDRLPWTRLHYMDPSVPGSLRAEIFPTMRYLQALWARLHGRFEGTQVVISAYPELPRRLRGADPASPDSWVTLLFGAAPRYEQAALSWGLTESPEQAVDFTKRNTRWGDPWPRLIRLTPNEPLEPGGWYTVELGAGVETIDGPVTQDPFEITFQVACDDPDDDACPDLGPLPEATIEPRDDFPHRPPTPDAGPDAQDAQDDAADAMPPELEDDAEHAEPDAPQGEEDAEPVPPNASNGASSGGKGGCSQTGGAPAPMGPGALIWAMWVIWRAKRRAPKGAPSP